jgi:hypothetical protein
MPKVLGYLLKALGAVAGLLILGIGYVVYSFSTPLKTVHISSGQAGVFTIGETKEQILTRLPSEIFSPRPKPAKCPKNWLEVSNMNTMERACLLSSDSWVEGISSTRSSCPEKTDINTELRFVSGKLSEVITECWRPK